MYSVYYFVILGFNGVYFGGLVEIESLRVFFKKDLRLVFLIRFFYMDVFDGMFFKFVVGSVSIISFKDVIIKFMNGKV